MKRLFQFLGRIMDDLLAVAGAGLITYGAYAIYAPAGYIVAGLLLITGAVVIARGGRP